MKTFFNINFWRMVVSGLFVGLIILYWDCIKELAINQTWKSIIIFLIGVLIIWKILYIWRFLKFIFKSIWHWIKNILTIHKLYARVSVLEEELKPKSVLTKNKDGQPVIYGGVVGKFFK